MEAAESESEDLHLRYVVAFNRDSGEKQSPGFILRSDNFNRLFDIVLNLETFFGFSLLFMCLFGCAEKELQSHTHKEKKEGCICCFGVKDCFFYIKMINDERTL